jgi:hypothetical protein
MIVENIEQYNKFPDGTTFRIYLTGDDWYDPSDPICKKREVRCVKIGRKLYPIVDHTFFDFEERVDNFDPSLNYIVCNFEEDNRDVY